MYKENLEKLPYRKNVCCIVFKGDRFLLVQLNDWDSKWWKFPQGGVEDNESYDQAARRELKEEIGNTNFRILQASEITNQYDWPEEVVQETGYRWRGQDQRFCLVEYFGEDNDIRFDKKEIRRFKWVSYSELAEHIDHDSKLFMNYFNVVQRVLTEFNKLLNKKS